MDICTEDGVEFMNLTTFSEKGVDDFSIHKSTSPGFY